MSKRPQFSLKAILVIVTVLAVPLAMIATDVPVMVTSGAMLGFSVFGGSVGYLVKDWRGLGLGALFGLQAYYILTATYLILKALGGQS